MALVDLVVVSGGGTAARGLKKPGPKTGAFTWSTMRTEPARAAGEVEAEAAGEHAAKEVVQHSWQDSGVEDAA